MMHTPTADPPKDIEDFANLSDHRPVSAEFVLKRTSEDP